MPLGKLTELQTEVLKALADLQPRWTLVGGAALAGVHLSHRETRDLDLFWRGRDQLGELVGGVLDRCKAAGLSVQRIQSSPSFSRLRVSRGAETVVLDLVADLPLALDHDVLVTIGGGIEIQVASPREILVDKLCSLLSRSELRDLQDVSALVEAGHDLNHALLDAPKKDGGFSPLTLAWTLRSLNPERLAAAAGFDAQTTKRLVGFRDELIERLLRLSKPSDS